jgi:hypothetical protein
MVVCVEVCVWEPVAGFPEDGEGSLKALLMMGERDCMIDRWFEQARKEGVRVSDGSAGAGEGWLGLLGTDV